MTDKPIFRLGLNDPELQKKLDDVKKRMLADSPEHIQKLGKILRRRSIFSLHRFLVEQGLAGQVKKSDLPILLDYLITQRIDLQDMEPQARKNLRDRTLEGQPLEEMSHDYTVHVFGGSIKECKHCKWFMEVPDDEEKHCVALGSKGSDFPCYGFTSKNQV
jgi:hypothetical protein